ncbi:hypothetical protein BD626DRAFT_634214 [Schizophyllum amplum]|uniref:Uncharacterized protein n=1 Tax=Schizophyllum amplum TaxID=97359 RepID=A0A550C018_9AGAR|nr:hypothetical protein BD626DRAFT_576178 [Auriculariopsis ampla]TRM58045.1 hypothetical protein BD626DRAFT_573864 [Auriculariopsis ampla]TRM58134.1 hypothetical protein BD626DRAFT_634214 [Auriculariopsis ampla]
MCVICTDRKCEVIRLLKFMIRSERTPAIVAESLEKERQRMKQLEENMRAMKRLIDDLHVTYPRAYYDNEDTDARDAEELAESATTDEEE